MDPLGNQQPTSSCPRVQGRASQAVKADIEGAKTLIEKRLGKEDMFIPGYVATCLMILFKRLVPVEFTWVPGFELCQEKHSALYYHILKLNEPQSKWTLISWEDGDEDNFVSRD